MRKVLLVGSILILSQLIGFSQEVTVAPYTLFKAGKYREAIKIANKVISEDRTNVSAYAVKGWSYLSLRQWNNALTSGLAAEKINNNDPRIIQIIGEAYYELADEDKAKKYFSRYLTLYPQGQLRSWVYFFLGNIYVKNNKLHKADISYSTALALDKNRINWWLELAQVQEKQGRKNEASATYKKVLSLDSNNTVARQKIQQMNTN